MSDFHWPQDFRHYDVKSRGESLPAVTGCDGFREHVVAKNGVWYEVLPLPEDHPGRDDVMTPREVKPLENEALLKELGPADEWLAKREAAFKDLYAS